LKNQEVKIKNEKGELHQTRHMVWDVIVETDGRSINSNQRVFWSLWLQRKIKKIEKTEKTPTEKIEKTSAPHSTHASRLHQRALDVSRAPGHRPRRQTARGDRSCPLPLPTRILYAISQSTFETSRCNICNIRLKTDKTLQTCFWTHLQKHLEKHMKNIAKHKQYPDKTLAAYVWNVCNIQINTLATYTYEKTDKT
jgi:hypothetical protein